MRRRIGRWDILVEKKFMDQQFTEPIAVSTSARPRFRLRLSFHRHIPRALKILLRLSMKKYVGRKRNTAVAELQCKVNAMTLTYSAASLSRHQNTNGYT